MFIIISSFLAAASLYIALRPLITFFRDEKGFRQYPSQNWLSGITALAYGWEVGRKHLCFHSKRLHDAHQKHSVIRVGPNWLSFGGSRAVDDIYGYHSPCNKGDIYAALQGGGKNLANMVSRSEHSHRRHIVAAAYAPKNIATWEPLVTDSVMKLLKQMDELCHLHATSMDTVSTGKDLVFDGVHWSYLFSVEAITKIGLSKDLHFVESGNDFVPTTNAVGQIKNISFRESFRGGMRATATLLWDTKWFLFHKKVTVALSRKYKENWQHGEDSRAIITQLVKERMEKYDCGATFMDLFQPMVADKSDGTPEINEQDKIAEIDQMINAGVDAVATSLACTLYYLIKNPNALKKVRAELDSALSPTDSIASWAQVRNLTFLRACIEESMRLAPPVATDLVRRTPPEGTQIDGQMIAGNTLVSISAYTAHRDPDIFPDPEAFRPERWLAKGDEKLREMLTKSIPFTTGSRGCIGRNVTMLVQRLFLASLCHRYEFALPSSDWQMQWEEYFNLWPVRLPLKIWRRH